MLNLKYLTAGFGALAVVAMTPAHAELRHVTVARPVTVFHPAPGFHHGGNGSGVAWGIAGITTLGVLGALAAAPPAVYAPPPVYYAPPAVVYPPPYMYWRGY
jgi:hypothetical protein